MGNKKDFLEKYLFLEGKDWNIYLYQNHYIKMLQNLDEKDIGFDYLSINYNSNCDIEKFCLKIKLIFP